MIASLTRENFAERKVEITNLPWTQTEKDNAPDAELDNVPDVTRNPCCLSVLSLMKRSISWKTKMNLEEDCASIDISWTIDQAEFDDLLALKKDSAPGPGGLGPTFLCQYLWSCLKKRYLS